MTITTTDNRRVYLRRLNANDLDGLYDYLENLSPETKKRFGPHPFDKQSIIDFYAYPDIHWGYVAHTTDTNEIVAYSIFKLGYLESDYKRFLSYGIVLDGKLDCAFAPSVADLWQGCGIGNRLFYFMLADLKKTGIQRIVLWGGVQADNQKALNYYKKRNFRVLGQFSRNGENYDMWLKI
jgi:ribosomal protein S18 acetylase RimI-like enzyme